MLTTEEMSSTDTGKEASTEGPVTLSQAPWGEAVKAQRGAPDPQVTCFPGFPGHLPLPIMGKQRRAKDQLPYYSVRGQRGELPGPRQELRARGAAWPLGQAEVCGHATIRSSGASSSQAYWSRLTFLVQKAPCPWTKSSCLVAARDWPSEPRFRGALAAWLPPLP